jgi:autotransporter-associated beta strand protein
MFFGSRMLAQVAASLRLDARRSVLGSQKNRPVAEELEDRTLLSALYWDPSGATVAAGGAGTWDTTIAQWRSGSPSGPLVAWDNSANDDAIFPAIAGTVTLGVDITAKSLTFKADGYSLVGNSLTLTSSGRVNAPSGATATIGSLLVGSGGLTKIGGGTLILSAANSFSGRTNISSGVLELANAQSAQNSIVSVGAANGLTFGSGIGSFQISGLASRGNVALSDIGNAAVSIVVDGTGPNNIYSGVLSGLGSLTVDGGTQTLSGANTYAGGTTLSAGQLNIDNAKAIGPGTLNINGGAIDDTAGVPIVLKTNNAQMWNGDFAFGGSSNLNLGSGPVTLTENLTLTDIRRTLTVGGTISDSALGYGITKTGVGTLLLSGANSFSGPSTINNGVLQLGNPNAVQNSTVMLNQANGLRFSAKINSFVLGGLIGDVAESLTVAGSKKITLAIGSNGSSSSYSGILSGVGSIELVGGMLALSGSNTYSGGTIVNAGILLANNISGSGTGSGTVIINSGGMLGGTGSAGGAVTVNTGGTLAPGTSETAGFSSGTLTLASDSNLLIDLDGIAAGNGGAQVNVSGAADIDGSNLILDGSASLSEGESLDVLSATNAINGTFQGLPQSGTFSYKGVTYSADYTGEEGHESVLTTVAASTTIVIAPIAPTTPVVPTAPTSPVATPPVAITPTPPIGTLPAPSPTESSIPATPGTPIVSAPTSSQINIAWTAVAQADNYVVQRSLNGSSGWVTIGTPTSASWTDQGLSSSATYYYQVAASNSVGVSPYSATVSTASLYSTALTPSISGNATANHGVVYTLNLSAPTANRFPANAVLQSWTINWGDGTVSLPDLTLVRSQLGLAYHTYLTTGPETITASATNPYGTYAAAPLNIMVGNAPVVSAFQVNDGSAQRSMVDSLTVTFDEPVRLSASAFQLTQTAATEQLSPGPIGLVLTSAGGGTTYVLSFPNSSFSSDVGNSLPNGIYELTVAAQDVTDSGGGAMQFDAHFNFDRLFGDFNGSGTVDSTDTTVFNQSFGTTRSQAGYLWYADAADDGAVDQTSLTAFDADSGVSYDPTTSLNTISSATMGTPATISVVAGSYGNNGDTLSYLWIVTGPNGAFSVPGGNVTSVGQITIVPNAPGNWSASVVVTDTNLSLSSGIESEPFNVVSNSPAQLLEAKFDSNGLSDLAYNGTTLAGPGTSAVTYPTMSDFLFSVELVDGNGNPQDGTSSSTTLNGTWNEATTTETYVYDFPASTPLVTISVQYIVGINSLGFNITATNTSPYTLTGFSLGLLNTLQFPESSTKGPINASGQSFDGGVQEAFISDQPSYLTADYGTGTVVLGVQQQSPGYLSFSSQQTSISSNTYGIFFETDSASASTNPSWPVLNSPIAAGHSATYNINMRFGPTGSGTQLASDYIQAFATDNPFNMQWNDRRPITEIYPTGQGGVSSTNPRGWFNDPTVNVTTAAGLAAFSTRLLQSADASIALMKSMGSQGMIAWDLEGWEFQGYDNAGGFTTYVGDPTQATTLAPELSTTDNVAPGYADVLDEYFAKFRNAGLEVGMTLRLSQVEFINGQAFQEPVADPAQLLISKIEYAKQHWGATLFYIDSTDVSLPYYDVAGLLATVHAAEPDVLLIPEEVPIAGLASAAAYGELPAASTGTLVAGADAITSTVDQLEYPGAFSVIRSDKDRNVGEADVPALTEGIARGDTYFVQSVNNSVREAFNDIALKDAYPGKQIYSNDTFVLRLYMPANSSDAEYQILRDGLVVDSFLASSTTSLNFDFAGAHDNLEIDLSGGNPVPSGGVSFDGTSLSNGDSLTIVGAPGDATITVNNSSVMIGNGTVSFAHVANVSVDPRGGSGSAIALPALLIANPVAQIDSSPAALASSSKVSTASIFSDDELIDQRRRGKRLFSL